MPTDVGAIENAAGRARHLAPRHAEAHAHPPAIGERGRRGGSGGLSALRALRTALSWVLLGVLVLVASASLALSIASHRSPDGEATVFGHPVMSVLSGSMSPTIRTGDLVIDDPLTASQAASLHVGQIITFESPSDRAVFFTHRIVAVRHGPRGVSYVTKGDANDAPDALPVPAGNVVGLYKVRLPFGGYVLGALHEPFVLMMLVLGVALALLALSLWRLGRPPKHPAPARRGRPGVTPGAALLPVPSQGSPSRSHHPSSPTTHPHRSQ